MREKYANWHLDTKTNEDIIQEEDIQILQGWRSLVGNAPGEVKRTGYGFGIEDIEGDNSPRGWPWWKFSTSGKDKVIAMDKE